MPEALTNADLIGRSGNTNPDNPVDALLNGCNTDSVNVPAETWKEVWGTGDMLSAYDVRTFLKRKHPHVTIYCKQWPRGPWGVFIVGECDPLTEEQIRKRCERINQQLMEEEDARDQAI